jgi:hypothetical protein
MKLCRQSSLVISKTVNEKGWRQAKSEQEAGMMEVYMQAGGMHETCWRHAEAGQEADRSR